MDPRTMFLLEPPDMNSVPSWPLANLMEAMGLPEAETFGEANQLIQKADWARFPGKSPAEKDLLQQRAAELTPFLSQLGVLIPELWDASIMPNVTRAIWPGASFGQIRDRLVGGKQLLWAEKLPLLRHIDAIAALERKAVGTEVQQIEMAGLDVNAIVFRKDSDSTAWIREGEMMRQWWMKEISKDASLSSIQLTVITTDMVPESALHGRPTTAATILRWEAYHRERSTLPTHAAVWSICPYALRPYMQARKHVPATQWYVCASLPTQWNVAGAISEVAKIVYDLAIGDL